MKEFIYLDTTFLHSFIAQTHDGLPTLVNTELQEQQNRTSTTASTEESSTDVNGEVNTGNLNIPGIFNSPSGKGGARMGNRAVDVETISLSQTEAGKEIITKQLHDDALAKFETYLVNKDLIINKTGSEDSLAGEYVGITGHFSVIDLQYLQNAMKPSTISEFMAFSTKNEIEEQFNAQEKTPKTREARNKALKEIEQEKKKFEEQFSFFEQAINYIVGLMASKSFIRVGKYVSPMKPEFLRDSPRELSFKYGSTSSIEVTIIGRVTRVYTTLIPPITETDSMFSALNGLSGMVDSFLSHINLIAKDDIIVSPVAIYFE